MHDVSIHSFVVSLLLLLLLLSCVDSWIRLHTICSDDGSCGSSYDEHSAVAVAGSGGGND